MDRGKVHFGAAIQLSIKARSGPTIFHWLEIHTRQKKHRLSRCEKSYRNIYFNLEYLNAK